jgi:hypothetical protein
MFMTVDPLRQVRPSPVPLLAKTEAFPEKSEDKESSVRPRRAEYAAELSCSTNGPVISECGISSRSR